LKKKIYQIYKKIINRLIKEGKHKQQKLGINKEKKNR